MKRLCAAFATLTLILAGLAAPAAAQSSVSFGAPAAVGSFGQTITFSTTFDASQPPDRIELLLRLSGDDREQVEIATVERVDTDTYRAAVFQGGHIVPNTQYDFRFRAVTPEGPVLGPEASHRVVDPRVDWHVLEGERVNVWWHEGGDGFGQRALDLAETAVSDAATLLGIDDIEPVDFIIYGDTRQFRDAMGPATRENVGGQAHPGIRTLFGLIEPRQIRSDWVEELVVHELAHLVFDEAVRNPYQYPPRWLNEGLAVYLAKGYDDGDRGQVQRAAGSDTIIPLQGLGGQFPTRPHRFSLAYAESVAAVDYFVETYGEDKLVELVTSFADGTGVNEAFLRATGADYATFDDAWLASLGTDQPEAYGPVDGEPGSQPSAWAD